MPPNFGLECEHLQKSKCLETLVGQSVIGHCGHHQIVLVPSLGFLNILWKLFVAARK